MRIAVAGSAATGTSNAHFGFAEHFDVFDLDLTDQQPHFVETRRSTPHCRDTGGDRSLLDRSADLLADCQAVVAAAVGPCARRALTRRGVLAVEHDGPGLTGADALLSAVRTHLDKRVHVKEPAR